MERNGFEIFAAILNELLDGLAFFGFIVVCLAFIIGFGG
jgi:hypothetical protein